MHMHEQMRQCMQQLQAGDNLLASSKVRQPCGEASSLILNVRFFGHASAGKIAGSLGERGIPRGKRPRVLQGLWVAWCWAPRFPATILLSA